MKLQRKLPKFQGKPFLNFPPKIINPNFLGRFKNQIIAKLLWQTKEIEEKNLID